MFFQRQPMSSPLFSGNPLFTGNPFIQHAGLTPFGAALPYSVPPQFSVPGIPQFPQTVAPFQTAAALGWSNPILPLNWNPYLGLNALSFTVPSQIGTPYQAFGGVPGFGGIGQQVTPEVNPMVAALAMQALCGAIGQHGLGVGVNPVAGTSWTQPQAQHLLGQAGVLGGAQQNVPYGIAGGLPGVNLTTPFGLGIGLQGQGAGLGFNPGLTQGVAQGLGNVPIGIGNVSQGIDPTTQALLLQQLYGHGIQQLPIRSLIGDPQFGQGIPQQFGQGIPPQFGQGIPPQFGQGIPPQFGQLFGQQFGQPFGQQFGQPFSQQFGVPGIAPGLSIFGQGQDPYAAIVHARLMSQLASNPYRV